MRSNRIIAAAGTVIAFAACARETPREAVSVEIVRPQEGAVVVGDSVQVELSASGVEIAPATGEVKPGEAHHHLFLDIDVTPAGEPIPDATTMEGLKHLGTGASVWTFKNLAPGEHRLIAVLADGEHVPLEPWAVDTVRFGVVASDTTP